jgi:16S rRNA (cytosine967-C5)-methyltransferase
MAHSTQNARLTSLHVLIKVLQEQHSLSECLPPALDPLVDSRDRALAQALCYGVLRYLPYLQALLTPLLRKPFKAKDRDVEILLLMGIYQQLYTRIPPHAAIAETVQLTRHIQKTGRLAWPMVFYVAFSGNASN